MKILLTIRNRIETFFNRFPMALRFVLRLLISFFVLLAVRNGLGYNALLSHLWFVIAFAVVCAFIPVRVLPLVLGAYTSVQIVSLSVGVAVTAFIIMLIIYLMYLRMNARYGYVLLLMLLACVLRIPLVIPLVLAVSMPMSSIAVVISGCIVYYMFHYISINSVVITGYTGSGELAAASVFINGLLTYKEFVYTLLLLTLVFFIVYFVKKINMNRANDMAVAIGAGSYVIMALITHVILNSLTFQRLRTILIGTAVALVVALIAENIILPVDFSKAELLEFDDEEYHYYVRAVPKVALDRENVRITRISGRKKVPAAKGSAQTSRKDAAPSAEGRK